MKNCKEIIEGLPEVIEETFSETNSDLQPVGGIVLPPLPLRRLRDGCYLLTYWEDEEFGGFADQYFGTLRVDRETFGITASGDLYLHQRFGESTSRAAPHPGAGIPIFPIQRYTYYLRVTSILYGSTTDSSFTLRFERFRYNRTTRTWTNTGLFNAEMRWATAPATYPSRDFYLTGTVRNWFGRGVGRLSMGWVASKLRKGTIEIDRVASAEFPAGNGAGVDWRSVFEGNGWEINVIESEIRLREPSGTEWSNAELHYAMLNERDLSDLDGEWRYHLLCVRLLDATPRGIMYDAGGTDSNNIPREGAALASHWVIPDTPGWGSVRGRRFGQAVGPYFRTAVHEIGHAMGLAHNFANNGFMQVTPHIVTTGGGSFPDNIEWDFHREDARRLKHWPDICVRPGGAPFGRCSTSAPLSPFQPVFPVGLLFTVEPLQIVFPIGAPVRVNIELKNIGTEPVQVPKRLSLASSVVKGKVETPGGVKKGFQSIYHCVDGEELTTLAPGETLAHDLTLLRGADGPLFASCGLHEITVEVEWESDVQASQVSNSCHVMVTPPVDEAHAVAATRLLATPDVHLVLIMGGDHLKEGIEAIKAALKNKVLRPHYALIEAKRIGRRFLQRKPDAAGACKLLDKSAIMSASEARRMLDIFEQGDTKRAMQIPNEVNELLKGKVRK